MLRLEAIVFAKPHSSDIGLVTPCRKARHEGFADRRNQGSMRGRSLAQQRQRRQKFAFLSSEGGAERKWLTVPGFDTGTQRIGDEIWRISRPLGRDPEAAFYLLRLPSVVQSSSWNCASAIDAIVVMQSRSLALRRSSMPYSVMKMSRRYRRMVMWS